MIDPKDIYIMIPSHDRRLDCACVAGLLECRYFYERQPFFLLGISDIALARNMLAHKFLKENYEWLMFIDSDIEFRARDWQILYEGDEEIVTAEYARKVFGEPPAAYGLGFTRIHRSVFERINNAVDEKTGIEKAQRYYMLGELTTYFFAAGVTGDSRYVSEDRGFFLHAAHSAGATHRLEKRCHLGHVGNFVFGYPDQIKDSSSIVQGNTNQNMFIPENTSGAN